MGILCAPDEPKGGWRLLREMRPGDVILHNASSMIHAVSVVEGMDPTDDRLPPGRVQVTGRPVGACLPYTGRHLSIDDHDARQLIACLVTVIDQDVSVPAAVRSYGHYALRVRPEVLSGRPDLRSVVERASWAALTEVDDEPPVSTLAS